MAGTASLKVNEFLTLNPFVIYNRMVAIQPPERRYLETRAILNEKRSYL